MLQHNQLSVIARTALLIIFIASTLDLYAVPQRSNYYPNDQQSIALREVRDTLENMKHSVSNQQIELRTFDEKLNNLDDIIESVRDQINESARSHKDQLKSSSTALETKLITLESSLKGIMTDLKQFQNYTVESTTTLTQYKKKITDLEKTIELQNQNIDDLQAAVKALMDVFQVKNGITTKINNDAAPTTLTTSPTGELLYKIKEGDNLEKIAKANQTTVKAIRELNNLANDKIVVGRTLKIPQK